MRITIAKLKTLGARCEEQVEIFRQEWPDGAAITRKNVLRAVELRLNVDWVALRLLPEPLLAEYERQVVLLWAEYERQRAPLWAEYNRQMALLWDEYARQKALLVAKYKRQKALLLAECMRQETLLWDEYSQQKAPVWAEYKRQVALLFWRLSSRGKGRANDE